MIEKNKCPVCGNKSLISTVYRKYIPVMQNYVYKSKEKAMNSNKGEFSLEICDNCGFGFNSKFDNSLLTYDEGYDNSIPSSVFHSYHLDIVNYLNQNYPIEKGFIVDIGCGKGEFLKTLCKQFPKATGLGIDPSCEIKGHIKEDEIKNVKFIQDVFKPEYITHRPSLVICRHILEHIEEPVDFLESIKQSLKLYSDTPFFFEIPDTEWIIENEAFWDFCYEHCNYYSISSFSNLLRLSGFKVIKMKKGFGDQYLWIETCINDDEKKKSINSANNNNFIEKILAYSKKEVKNILAIKEKLSNFKTEGKIIAIWGMATKGVVLSNLIDEDLKIIDVCIDINSNKQGKFIPLLGHEIVAPERLTNFKNESLIIIIMNPNYTNEIKEEVAEFSLKANFYNASDLTH